MTTTRSKKSTKDPRGNRYGEALQQRALTLLREGKTAKTVAKALKVSIFSVKTWKKKAGVVRDKNPSRNGSPKIDPWAALETAVNELIEATVADSCKGGGDPTDYEMIETHLKLCQLQYQYALRQLRTRFDPE